ncbi:MAG: AAA family ATPase [Chloroflexota bacterium]
MRQRDDGQFFGFKTVAQGYLGRFTQFLYIPAVRDASDDASEGRGSVLTQLMDLVVRSVLANNIALSQLKETVQEQYETIMAPANLTEINDLAQQMTQTLKTYVPGAGVQLDWSSEDINIPLPKANIKLVEDGYSSTVTRAGHGLQRAFILTMLQHLAAAQTNTNDEIITEGLGKQLPNFALVIEEPELYQHPNRQRHFAKVLWDLTTGSTPGVADQTQVIYGTHSPLFVGIDRIDQVRRLRKEVQEANKPKITKVIQTSLNKVAEEVWRIDGEPRNRYTAQTLLPRLQAIMTPWMSEGFFADVVILVEGEDDRAALLGMAKAMDVELEGRGFSVIPCGGKSNLDRPLLIFRELDIPVYVIWDGDFKKGEAAGICEKCGRRLDSRANPKDNHRLLRLVGWATPEEDWPEYIEEKFTCFKHDLETMLKNEIGSDLFESYLDECKNELSIPKRKHAIKNPNVLAYIIKNAQKQGCTSQTLEQTIDKILMLKS